MAPSPGGGIRFASRVLRLETREPPLAFDRPGNGFGVLIRMCSWCKDVEVADGEWADLDRAVGRLGLLGHATGPEITHGICPVCADRFSPGADRQATGSGTIRPSNR